MYLYKDNHYHPIFNLKNIYKSFLFSIGKKIPSSAGTQSVKTKNNNGSNLTDTTRKNKIIVENNNFTISKVDLFNYNMLNFLKKPINIYLNNLSVLFGLKLFLFSFLIKIMVTLISIYSACLGNICIGLIILYI